MGLRKKGSESRSNILLQKLTIQAWLSFELRLQYCSAVDTRMYRRGNTVTKQYGLYVKDGRRAY